MTGAGRRGLAVLLLSVASFGASAADGRDSLGFGIEVDGSGFFVDPTIVSVTVTSATVSSAAASAGIAVKDRIVEADGRPVVGAKARALAPLLKKEVGESLRLRLRLVRPNGDAHRATLVATPPMATS